MVLGIISTSNIAFANNIYYSNYTQDTPPQCNYPIKTLAVAANSGNVTYNVTTLHAPISSCITISFQNLDTIAHTFTINNDSIYNLSVFNIYLPNLGSKSLNFQTANSSVNLTYYCAVPGHDAAGQYGTLIIGNPTNSSQITQNSSSQSTTSTPYSTTTLPSLPSTATVNTSPSFEIISLFSVFMVSLVIKRRIIK